MARQVLPIVGAIVGAYFGSPQLGYAIGAIIGNAVDPQKLNGPKLGEAQTQTSREGVYRPLVFGTGAVMGNIIHRGPEVVRTTKESQGKGGGPVIETERRYRTFAIRLAEAHKEAGYELLRIWEGEKLVYDARPGTTIRDESAQYARRFRFYKGTEEQLPDPAIEAYMGVGNVSSYRGSCYIVFENFDLTDYRDMIPQIRAEISSAATAFVPGTILSLGLISVDNVRTSASVDGDFWYPAEIPPFNPTNLVAVKDNRFLIYNNESASYTDDFGSTWNTSTDTFTGIGVGPAAHLDGVILIPAALDCVYKSVDNGESFFRVIVPSIRPNHIQFASNTLAIGYGIYANTFYRGTADGAIWEVAGITSLIMSLGGSSCSHIGSVYFGGSDSSFRPAVAITADGFTSGFSILSEETSYVSAICGNNNPSSPIIIAGTSTGKFFYSTGLDWQIVDFEFPGGAPVQAISWNGERFVAGGGASTGYTAYSFTGDSGWEYVDTPLEYSVNDIDSQPPTVEIVDSGRVPLSQVVEFCHDRVYQSPSKYDTSEIESLIDGVVFADGYTGRDAITTVLATEFIDAFEGDRGSGYKINYVKRGKPALKTITFDDLVDDPEDSIREDALERPRVMHLHYQSPFIGYAVAKASIQRISPDAKVSGEASIQTPITYNNPDEPLRIADVMMRQAWTEVNGERELSISDENLDVVPTDVLTIFLRGKVSRERVTKTEIIDGVIKLKTIADRQSNYTSNLTAPSLPAPTPPPASIAGVTEFAVIDEAAFRESDDRLGYYVAATGSSDGWGGAVVQRQVDSGQYSTVATFNVSTRSTIGILQNEVTASSPHYTDTTNSLVINLLRDEEIESLTEQQFLSEGGALALEWDDSSGTRWEILQYRDAEQNTDGSWTLSHLARGRLNTNAVEHSPGARFVLLESAQFVEAPSSMIGASVTHRGVSIGTSPETAPTRVITYAGRNQIEWPVANILGAVDSGSIQLTAIPRSRLGTEDSPIQSANWQGYRFSITDGINQSTVDSLSASVSFSISGWSSPITARVSQINRITGAGPNVTEQF